MAGERDVLAAALADTPHSSSFVDQVSGARLGWLLLNERAKAHIRGEAEAILAALAARGYTLSKSAPDREALRAARHLLVGFILNEVVTTDEKRAALHSAAATLYDAAATPPAEPLPREALDVERLARAMASVEYQVDPSQKDIRKARRYAAEYATLSKSAPDPDETTYWTRRLRAMTHPEPTATPPAEPAP